MRDTFSSDMVSLENGFFICSDKVKSMKRWYVIQVYAGYESAVKADIEKRIKDEHLQDLFGEILIPSAKMKQLFAAQEIKDEQLFPGYMLIQMISSPVTIRVVTASHRVIKFLGGKEPISLSQKEVDRTLSQMRGEVAVARSEKADFVVGSELEISEGPFAGFVGIIDRVDAEQDKLTIMVSIFGRMTPVEIGYNQVKR